ncbi:MAG TPA: FAD-binding oxidoreductase [Thermoplasmata archaeon]|nr:FAD-binding oxidoreductase [Thermoplasmata archaeon]
MSRLARDRYRVVVVGAGVIGLYTAYHLASAGAGPILVVDRGFLSNGASGRNGGGVRQQWETRSTVRLAKEAVHAYRRFGSEFGQNIWFRQGGYLFLAESPGELDRLKAVDRVVAAEGLPSRLVDPDGVRRLAPAISLERVVGGSFLASDGTLYPFPVLWGLYERVRALGVEVALGVEATRVRTEAGRAIGLDTSEGPVGADVLLNAAGGWSGELSRSAGLTVPNVATLHEILVTEPLRRFLDPMVIRLSDGLYVSQTVRGELVGGLTFPHPSGTSRGMGSSPEFLSTMARALVRLVPRLSSVGIVRAWSGYYDETPDGFPVIGEDPRLRGFVHANGFGGHGFMLAPAATRRVAKAVLGEPTDLDPREFGPGRFLEPGRPGTIERLQPG